MQNFIVFVSICLVRVIFCANNVCKTLLDYSDSVENKNCWYNPDLDSTPEEIARRYGFEFKNFRVLSTDRYLLNLFRIQNRNGENQINQQPILLHHGLVSSAMSFMSVGNRSLAFYLAKKGFDVWLANVRGNPYSSGHLTVKMTDPQYWDFSFHEMAINDLPIILEFIKKRTGTKIIYIGHSMGTTISFIYSSLKKKHSEEHLKGMVAVAPVTSLKYLSSSPIHRFVGFGQEMMSYFELRKLVVLFPYEKEQRRILVNFCSHYPMIENCLLFIYLLQGPSEGELLAEDIPALINHHPARTSVKTLNHFLQIILAGRFQHYDYGIEENLRLYNLTEPPIYPVEKIRLPVHMFYGKNDFLAVTEDVHLIYKQLKTKQKTLSSVPKTKNINYNHLDFLYGKNNEQFFYQRLLKAINKLL